MSSSQNFVFTSSVFRKFRTFISGGRFMLKKRKMCNFIENLECIYLYKSDAEYRYYFT